MSRKVLGVNVVSSEYGWNPPPYRNAVMSAVTFSSRSPDHHPHTRFGLERVGSTS